MHWLCVAAEEKALPTGFSAAKLDKGHKGMTLDDFVKHPAAVAADLDRATVLALRLYTTSAYKSINRPLREGRKHPYPALVAYIVNGITKLRAVAAKKEDQRPVECFRGLKIDPSDEFFGRGATDLSFMSAMRTDKKVAERAVSSEGANASVLIKMQLTPEQLGAVRTARIPRRPRVARQPSKTACRLLGRAHRPPAAADARGVSSFVGYRTSRG